MTENWRVVREWSNIGEAGCLYFFRLEDVYEYPKGSSYPRPSPNVHPFIGHESHGLQVMGDTPERLRARLKVMLEALDKPVLEWTPRQLKEVVK